MWRRSGSTSSTTRQERRILVLIADVSSLLAKLGMERRTQAAVFAARLEDRR